jgi:hypothetical protein
MKSARLKSNINTRIEVELVPNFNMFYKKTTKRVQLWMRNYGTYEIVENCGQQIFFHYLLFPT